MDRGVRKLVVGFLALGVLLGVFLLYLRLNETVPVTVDVRAVPPELQTDANAMAGQVGTILGTDVRRVEQTQFFHTNEHSEVDREFGFEELLHKQGDQWEITRPYMRVFLPAFYCEVTAQRGKVRLETVFGRATPSDADFSGNVIIHVVPTDPNSPWEFFIRLDNVGFLAEKSLFSTTGPVRFLSRDAQVIGTGMELVYDGLRNRLELFRVSHLESGRLRSSAFRSLAGMNAQPGTASAGTSESAAPGGPSAASAVRTEPDPNETRDRYECVFRRNVTIQTPQGLIAAEDALLIHNVRWSQATGSGTDANSAEQHDTGAPAVAAPKDLPTSASSYQAFDSLPPESFDIVIACDGGFVMAPEAGGPASPGSAALTDSAPVQRDNRPLNPGGRERAHTSGGQYTAAQRIDFDDFTKDMTLGGPIEMMFYLDPNALNEKQPQRGPMPMTVSAQRSVRRLAASNQVLLEGDCTVTLRRSEPNLTYEYILTAPRFTLDLVSDPNASRQAGVRVRRFSTEGGPAALRIFRRGPDQQLLGETQLDAARLQYDADPQEFTAAGPGVLWVRNAEVIDVQADPNQFSLGRPCYACLNNFDRLQYSMATGRISAESRSRQLLFDYFPLTVTGYGHGMRVVAGQVEGLLRPDTTGRIDLAELTASHGIDYEDEKYHCAGSVLVYDRNKDLAIVRGDAVQPCLFNGARVDRIEMNLKTGSISAPISTPSVLPIQR